VGPAAFATDRETEQETIVRRDIAAAEVATAIRGERSTMHRCRRRMDIRRRMNMKTPPFHADVRFVESRGSPRDGTGLRQLLPDHHEVDVDEVVVELVF
jgi:hypothetical protein